MTISAGDLYNIVRRPKSAVVNFRVVNDFIVGHIDITTINYVLWLFTRHFEGLTVERKKGSTGTVIITRSSTVRV